MKLDIVPLSNRDFKDNTFLIRTSVSKPSLLNSIKDVGIINQPILRKKNDLCQIISGHKRLEACRELGIAEILSKVYQSYEITDEECLKIVFYENQERLADIERGELVLKFKTLCNLNENEFNQRVLSFLGILPSRRNFEKYLRLGMLDREIKDAFYSQKITVGQVVILSEAPTPLRTEILRKVLLKLKMNTNETREVVKEINEVAVRDKKGVNEVIDDILLKINPGDLRADSFRRELKLMRYPILTKVEEEFKDCLRDLTLPKDVTIQHSPFFEGNHVEIRMGITSSKRLSKILSYLSSVLNSGLVNRVLAIVKPGGPKSSPG